MTLWEVLWADARKQLLQRQRKRAPLDAAPPLITAQHADGAAARPLLAAVGDDGGDDDDPKAALKRHGGTEGGAAGGVEDEEVGSFLAATCADMFVHFVAAVVVGARRRVLDECTDQDDAMRLFHALKGVDFWECVTRAQVLRAAGASRKHK